MHLPHDWAKHDYGRTVNYSQLWWIVQAAGAAFSVLFKGGAGSAVDSIIPSLLAGLPGPDKQHHQAVEGLRVILGVRPQSFGSMVPQLLRPPLGSKSLHALAALAEASGGCPC